MWASSSQNRRERRAESEDKEALEQRGFWVRVDLRLDAIDTTNINRIEMGKKEIIKKASK